MKSWLILILFVVSVGGIFYINFFDLRLMGSNLDYFLYYVVTIATIYTIISKRKKIETAIENEIKSDDIAKASLMLLIFLVVLAVIIFIIEYLNGDFSSSTKLIIFALILFGYLVNKPRK